MRPRDVKVREGQKGEREGNKRKERPAYLVTIKQKNRKLQALFTFIGFHMLTLAGLKDGNGKSGN